MVTVQKSDKRQAAALRANRRVYWRQFYRNNKGLFALNAVLTMLIAGFNLVLSWLMQRIIDAAAGNPGQSLLSVALWCVGSFAVFVAVYAVYRRTQPRFLQRALEQYKAAVFGELTKKSISAFAGESTGKYISALTNDVASIETNYLSKIFSLINMGVSFVGALALMVHYSPLLTAVAIGLSFLPAAASMLTGNRLAQAEKAVSERNEVFVGTVKDLLTGFPVIKSFKAEAEAQRLFDRENARTEEAKRKRRVTEHSIQLLSMVTWVVAQMGVFLFGAYLAVTGRAVTPGVVIVFVQLMNYVLQPIGQVPSILANRKAAQGLVDKLAEAASANVREGGKAVDNRLDEGIEVRDRSFADEAGNPVLRDLNVVFEAGKSYALVGGSGSGKSTLLNLLMGSYDTYEGAICYDGEELRDIRSESLYDLISLVQQNVFVFNDTIRNNVTLFRSFDEAKVNEAIRKARLTELIESRGADFVCGENGSALSGGERQRISIARALLQGTPVLLIDEATAALDTATAFEVTQAILDIQGLTRIVVTHRLEEALLRRYDEILVLRGGQIAEQGTYAELMARQGLLYALYMVAQSAA